VRGSRAFALGLWMAAAAFVPLVPSSGQERVEQGLDIPVRPVQGPQAKRPYGPEQATGEPDTFEEGDLATAWASLRPDNGPEWLKVEFEKEVTVAEVRIRETFNPGAVTKVTAFDKDGNEQVLWEGREPQHQVPGDFVAAANKETASKSVKIYLDTRLVPGWNEIDAVQLVGKDATRQWAVRATASSTFANAGRGGDGEIVVLDPPDGRGGGKRPWGHEQATGAPDTMEAGDIPTAWASLRPDGGPEWLKLEYDNEANIAEVRIRETHNPGAVTKVTAFDKDGKEEVLWEGREPEHEFPGDFVVLVAKDRNIASKSVKIYLDTALVQGWNEIDAVRLVAKDGAGQWASRATASSTYAERVQGNVAPPPVDPRGRFNPPDPFADLADAPVKVKLQGNEVIEGVFVRSHGDFILIRQPAAKRLLIISKAQIILLEAPEPPARPGGGANGPDRLPGAVPHLRTR